MERKGKVMGVTSWYFASIIFSIIHQPLIVL